MVQHTNQLCFVYIGGPMSMETLTMQTDLDQLQVYRALIDSQYVCSEIIELCSPKRFVAVRGYADKCRTVRLEIFKQVAEVSYLVKKIGDVDVAMFRYIESLTNWEYNSREALHEMIALASTVQKQCESSKLAMRQSIKHDQKLLQGSE